MAGRAEWKSNTGFLLAALASAIGLGNIWRFPYIVYRNGGGAFLVPYFVALFVVGIPLLMLDSAWAPLSPGVSTISGPRSSRGSPGSAGGRYRS